jgi:Ca2+-transporting ATPase
VPLTLDRDTGLGPVHDESRTVAAPHSLAPDQLVAAVGSNLEKGLSDDQAVQARAVHGRNQLSETPPVPAWQRFLGQFKELVIWILIVAAVISGVMGEVADSLAILAIVLLNGVIGFLQEGRAEQALAALQKLSAPLAKVVRGGVLRTVPAAELVPGDLIELEAGDNVPADARLVTAFGLRVQEAALTGESTPVEKDASVVLPQGTPLGDRRNVVFMGTVAAAGKASAIIVATGMQTELGHIAGLLARQEPEPTPLQRRLAELGRILVVVCLVLVAIVFLLELRRGGQLLEVFLVAVSLAVAAVPEGLPAIVTLALALGLQRMAKRNALVRKLPSVETLGSVTVICSDKTGTLTRNEMMVRTLVAGDAEFRVSGSGYSPQGTFHRADGSLPRTSDSSTPASVAEALGPVVENLLKIDDLRLLLTTAVRCNNAKLVPGRTGGEPWQVIGDPTEGALLVAAMKARLDTSPNGYKLVSEIPFDSQRKAMSVIVREADGSEVMYTKGAPEVILEICSDELRDGREHPLTAERRKTIASRNTKLAQQALRVLALAYRQQPREGAGMFREENLVFVGLAGMIDPPREEAKEAVRLCDSAGIRPIMITGDHPATAKAIANELGILAQDGQVLIGADLESLSDEELAQQVEATSVYARVSAEHKLRVVKAWQSRGQVVAMTGDGVNDAPAIKAADIGIAMGISGTDVTKEASDMVLTDDNFASIVSAVEEGRTIYDNIQNFVHYLLTCNAGEVLFMFFAAVVGWPVPLAAIQILWINLVTDGLPALALAMEPPERHMMRRPPRPPREPVLTLRRGALILLQGALIAAATAIGFWFVYQGRPAALDHARTVAFCILAFTQLFFSFACRSQRYTLPQLGLFTNPHLLAAILVSGLLQFSVVLVPFARPVFEVTSHPIQEWLLIFVLALAPVTVVEIGKLVLAAVKSWGSSAAHAA